MADMEISPSRLPRVSVHQKILAGIVFAVAAIVLTFVDRLPSAVKVDGRLFQADHNEALALYGLPLSPVMSFDGAPGAGLDLRIDAARMVPEMVASLVQGGVPSPRTKAVALTWLGRTDPLGRITISITNLRNNPRAGLALASTGSVAIPQLRITAVDTELKVSAGSIAGDSLSAPAAVLKINGQPVPQPYASIIPLNFVVPSGQSLLLTFANAEAVNAASFRLGVPDDSGELASHLPLQRFAIGRREHTQSDRPFAAPDRGVCSAHSGRMLFMRLQPRPETCLADGTLAVESLDVAAGKLAIVVSGSGFEMMGGKTVAAGVVSAIANNKLVAALLAIAYATLAGWVWKTITGIGR